MGGAVPEFTRCIDQLERQRVQMLGVKCVEEFEAELDRHGLLIRREIESTWILLRAISAIILITFIVRLVGLSCGSCLLV